MLIITKQYIHTTIINRFILSLQVSSKPLLSETYIQKSNTHPTKHNMQGLKGMPCEEKIQFITIFMVQRILFLYVSTHDTYISHIAHCQRILFTGLIMFMKPMLQILILSKFLKTAAESNTK